MLKLPASPRRPPARIAGWHGTSSTKGRCHAESDGPPAQSIARHGLWPSNGLFGEAVYVALYPEVAERYINGTMIRVTVEVPAGGIEWFVDPDHDWHAGRISNRPIAGIIDNQYRNLEDVESRGGRPTGGWLGGTQLAVYDPALVKVDAAIPWA